MEVRRYISEIARPMMPKSTGVAPKLNRLEGIRGIAFDIYGTLLISEAGEVSSDSNGRNLKAMSLVSDHLGGALAPTSMLEEYEGEVSRCLSQARKAGVQHPEVEIRDVWREILSSRLSETPTAEMVEEVAIIYECASNPVWPMSGAREVLEVLALSDRKLGIVSNAQFYTPMIVEELFRKPLSNLGFSEDWVTFSYRLREGKPSRALFRDSSEHAADSGLSPGEILYVGNDMTKDIHPAASVGYRTCLFAGDARSLRLGEGNINKASEFADVVVTELGQILDVIDVKQ